MIQLTDHMMLKRKEHQRVDASVLLRTGIKIVRGSRGWEGLGRKRSGGGGKSGRIECRRRCTEGQEIEQRCAAMKGRELWVETRRS
jgi:hypothetical protein